MLRLLNAGVLLGAALLHVPFAIAATYVVSPDGTGDFPTIQSALDDPAVVDGDVIELTDGVFTGDGNRDITYGGKAVTVRSQSGNVEACILDAGSEPHWAVLFQDGEGPGSILERVTLWSSGNAGGVACLGTSPTIAECFVIEAWEEGILCEASSATIRDCVFRRNSTGLDCRMGSAPLVTGCTFELNSDGFAAGVRCDESSPTFEGCLFVDNLVADLGGAASFYDSSPTLRRCTFYRNEGVHGGHALELGNSDALIEQCLFVENTGSLGSTITCWGTSMPTLTCCNFFNNDLEGFCGIAGVDLFSADPLFCDPESGDFSLRPGSPCLPAGSPCGEQVGAFGEGCNIVDVPGGFVDAPVAILGAPRPHPVSGTFAYEIRLERESPVAVRIVDVQGRSVATVLEETLRAGTHRFSHAPIDDGGRPLPSGVYYLRVEAGRVREARSLIVTR